jgi:hypothetical protein
MLTQTLVTEVFLCALVYTQLGSCAAGVAAVDACRAWKAAVDVWSGSSRLLDYSFHLTTRPSVLVALCLDSVSIAWGRYRGDTACHRLQR